MMSIFSGREKRLGELWSGGEGDVATVTSLRGTEGFRRRSIPNRGLYRPDAELAGIGSAEDHWKSLMDYASQERRGARGGDTHGTDATQDIRNLTSVCRSFFFRPEMGIVTIQE